MISYHGRRIESEIDTRDMRGGDKVWGWIKAGVPLRVEIGPRDMAADSVFVARRDKGHKDKTSMPRQQFVQGISELLDEMQKGMFDRAKAFRKQHTKVIDSKHHFYSFFTPKSKDAEQPEIHGGFAMSHFCGDPAVEGQIKDELGVTVRCIPLKDEHGGAGKCVITGKPSTQRVVWAKAY